MRSVVMLALIGALSAPAFAQDLGPAALEKVTAGFSHSKPVLVVRLDLAQPEATLYDRHPLARVRLLTVRRGAGTSITLPQPTRITVRVTHVDETKINDVSLKFNDVTLEPNGPAVAIPGSTLYYREYSVDVPSGAAQTLVATGPRVTLVSGVTGNREFSISIGPEARYNFASEISALYVMQSASKPSFGLRKGVYSLSTKLDLDAVTLFKGGDNIDLGGALTYHFLIGKGGVGDTKGLFGFPLHLNVSVGFAGLDFKRIDGGKGAFIAVGVAIPTGKS